MNTRSLAARLKRLEFRRAPDYQQHTFHIYAVNSKGRPCTQCGWGSPRTNISRLMANPLRKRKPSVCLRLRKRRPAMRALHRRLLRLEDQFGPPVETEYSKELRRRIEAGRRRVAAARSETYVPWRPNVSIPGLTRAEAIFRGGRDRPR
jgi:hypothetical protein